MIPRSHPRTVIWTPSTFSGFLSTVRSTVKTSVCTETCAPETGGRWTWWSRIGWKEGKESGDGGRTTRSTRMCVAPDGKEISGIWGRCWSRIRNTIRRWGEGQVGQMLEKRERMSMLTGRWTLLMDFCFFRWSRQAACNGDSRAPRLSLELKRVILTTLPHSHSLMLSLFSYHRKTWHQFVKTLILLFFSFSVPYNFIEWLATHSVVGPTQPYVSDCHLLFLGSIFDF